MKALTLLAALMIAASSVHLEAARLQVLVTIPPQAEWVERVGGEGVEVTVLVPPGANPHTYEPTPRQLKKVAQADLYAIVGSGIEFEVAWLGKIRRLNPRLFILDCSKGVQRLADDPHLWLSLRNAQRMVENLLEGLSRLDPEHSGLYRERAEAYLKELRELDAELSRLFSNAKGRAFMTFHPAWGYFARDYGLRQLVIEQGGKSPSPKAMVRLAEEAKEEGISVIFASPQFDRRAAEAVARSIGAGVMLLDPLARDYLENMHRAAHAIARALGIFP
ncbi:MAG TPA: zinc ABC transporter substrate-binding protein [Armatimonadetes bacterium]|nr:zinc ABC transporter substrate-binding protein [Armatimonadota bacterium]